MGKYRRRLSPLLFGLACAVFNWPLVNLFLEQSPYAAFLGIFAAMGLLTAAIALVVALDPPEPSDTPETPAARAKPDQSDGGS